jgi:S1-C subfamily serine protease
MKVRATSAPARAATAPAAPTFSVPVWLLLALVTALAAVPLRAWLTPAEEPMPNPVTPPAAAAPAATAPAAVEPPQPASVPVTPVAATPDRLPIIAPTTAAMAALEDVVARAIPAVAAIHAGNARGTGFFVRRDTVLTNAHVVNGQSSVELQVNGAKYTARVVTVSAPSDLAVLQVYNASANQATLPLGSAQRARVGQEVIAIGSALGILSNTVTRGIVSAVRRSGDITLLQTDAAINPGNSGGPLIDREGQVVGINTMKALAGAESIGFAVAIDHATALLNGQAPTGAAGVAPAAGLDTLLRQGTGATADDTRAQGQQVYTRTLAGAAQRADQMDANWERYAPTCVSVAVNVGDRRWLASLETNGIRLATTSRLNCRDWLDTVTSNAREIDQAMRTANEAARRAGVFPGVLRDERRQHRLDWPGWDR